MTCFYPNPAINAGNYPITCSGPATTSATDGVTYNAAYLTYTPGTLTITPRPITVTAAASSKVYDATTASPATPTITTGSLAYTDTAAWTETYDNKNVGTTHVTTPAGTVSDGNGGKNYTVTFVPISTGVITKAPLTITAATNTKTYDGTPSAAATPVPAVLKGSDTVSGLIETYSTSNVGMNLVLTVSAGYTVNDGNGGNNYTVSTATNNTGVITRAPVTANIGAANKPYDGTTTAAITGCSLSGVLTVDTGNVTCNASGATFVSANAGTWTVTAAVSLAGGSSGNYALTSAAASTSATITQIPLTVTATGVKKDFDGTTNATVTLSDNRISTNDTFTDSYASANFSGSGPGTGIPVNVTGISISGTGAGNYILPLTTAADHGKHQRQHQPGGAFVERCELRIEHPRPADLAQWRTVADEQRYRDSVGMVGSRRPCHLGVHHYIPIPDLPRFQRPQHDRRWIRLCDPGLPNRKRHTGNDRDGRIHRVCGHCEQYRH